MTGEELLKQLLELTPEQRATQVTLKYECWCCDAYEASYFKFAPEDNRLEIE